MTSLPCPADRTPACSNPHVDGCPGCVVNCEPSRLHVEHPTYCVTAYTCTDCGHEWSTTWGGR